MTDRIIASWALVFASWVTLMAAWDAPSESANWLAACSVISGCTALYLCYRDFRELRD